MPEALYAGRTGVYFASAKKPENWPIDNRGTAGRENAE
jgi:hypothetical protein